MHDFSEGKRNKCMALTLVYIYLTWKVSFEGRLNKWSPKTWGSRALIGRPTVYSICVCIGGSPEIYNQRCLYSSMSLLVCKQRSFHLTGSHF